MKDLIDRQQAIDAMCEACSDWCDEGVCKKVSAIQKLPSAQPATDCISRKMAIDGILMFMPVELGKGASMAEQINYSAWKTAISCAESYVRTMPSAQPQRKTGRWISTGHIPKGDV